MRQISRTRVVRAKIDIPGGGWVIEDGVAVIVVDERLTPEEIDVIVCDVLTRLNVDRTGARE